MVRNITVYLEDGQSRAMESVRCGFIVTENEEGEETCHNDLIDNSEYPSLKALLDEVVGIFRVSRQEVVVNW